MAWWGAGFLLAVVAGVVLPDPIGWLILAVLVIAGSFAAVVEYSDNRVARELRQAEDTAKTRAHLRELRETDADVEAEWDGLMNATSPRPLGLKRELVDPARLRRVPGQRLPGSAS